MDIKSKPMGDYQTNCYIIKTNDGEIIIDPGIGAFSWVKENVKKPMAILNTHGHFDHVWSNQALKNEFNIPIYCPRDDAFMLNTDMFGHDVPPSEANFKVNPDEVINLGGLDIKFWHFPGHTPGCSAIEIKNSLFSGDFIFKRSIGRVDFPYSNPQDMKDSINKILKFEKDFDVYPGHGEFTTLKEEQQTLPTWLRFI